MSIVTMPSPPPNVASGVPAAVRRTTPTSVLNDEPGRASVTVPARTTFPSGATATPFGLSLPSGRRSTGTVAVPPVPNVASGVLPSSSSFVTEKLASALPGSA
jgi:hypothetical protein